MSAPSPRPFTISMTMRLRPPVKKVAEGWQEISREQVLDMPSGTRVVNGVPVDIEAIAG